MKKLYLVLFTLLLSCNSKPKLISKSNIITLNEILITPSCPPEMKLISGQYCSHVLQTCKTYMEPPSSTPFARCLEFNKSKCTGKKIEMNFCIDTEEYALPSNKLPLSDVSWTTAKGICEQNNKRLCLESEWEFACEGEDALPYTIGYSRPSKQCNIDIYKDVIYKNGLKDRREPLDSNPECVSPFGVHNMSGNVDEWVEVPKYQHSKVPDLWMRSSLKGGHWLPVRNRCRPRTDDHDEQFHQISIGFRCCKDTDVIP